MLREKLPLIQFHPVSDGIIKVFVTFFSTPLPHRCDFGASARSRTLLRRGQQERFGCSGEEVAIGESIFSFFLLFSCGHFELISARIFTTVTPRASSTVISSDTSAPLTSDCCGSLALESRNYIPLIDEGGRTGPGRAAGARLTMFRLRVSAEIPPDALRRRANFIFLHNRDRMQMRRVTAGVARQPGLAVGGASRRPYVLSEKEE